LNSAHIGYISFPYNSFSLSPPPPSSTLNVSNYTNLFPYTQKVLLSITTNPFGYVLIFPPLTNYKQDKDLISQTLTVLVSSMVILNGDFPKNYVSTIGFI
jgi:hypothetical protein